jgi:hypothetical protein
MTSHHAVLVPVVDPLTHEPELVDQTVDREMLTFERLGIGDVRMLIEKANRRPNNDAALLELVVRTQFVTVEAQQALLKIIEEPPESTSFQFVIPSDVTFLPTLESRFVRVTSEHETDTEAFTSFKKSPLSERLQAIEAACKNKDTKWQRAIKSGLTAYLRKNSAAYSAIELQRLQLVLTTLLTRGAANKMLLEELALTL